jgi:hypothetical protein
VIGWSLSQLLQGILSSVYLDGNKVQGWKMFPIPLHNLNEVSNYNPIVQAAYSAFGEKSTSRKRLLNKSGMCQNTYGMKNTYLFLSQLFFCILRHAQSSLHWILY